MAPMPRSYDRFHILLYMVSTSIATIVFVPRPISTDGLQETPTGLMVATVCGDDFL